MWEYWCRSHLFVTSPTSSWRQTYKDNHQEIKYLHFNFEKQIGVGSFSDVWLVSAKKNGQHFAAKQLSKHYIIRTGHYQSVQAERTALTKVKHPNVVRLYAGFQDPSYLYLLMHYAAKGDLLKFTPLPFPCCRFYAAELLETLDYLHTQAFIIHRLNGMVGGFHGLLTLEFFLET
eukprot:TRINITY_DN9718_c0_g1_i6.p1 TRINITY_DN9718_c0_g1~~TRINITY_DN9718_c0_g1_i6.p1  ORF type:complete len:175 (+),score=15.13 TRINITY_DN9718_c0_g1_i6:408-932(+)